MTASPWDGTAGREVGRRARARAATAAGPEHEAFDHLLSVLVPGEDIVWTGRAGQISAAAGMAKNCLLLAATTGVMMTLVFLFGGWFAILQFFALLPAFGAVVTLPVAVFDLIVAGRTYYAVTTERVLVVRIWPRRSVEILMPNWIVEVRRKCGIGGQESLEIRQTEVTGVRMISNMFRESRAGPVLTLYGIEGIESAAAAIDKLRPWRRSLITPSLRPVDTVARSNGPSARAAVLEDAPGLDRSSVLEAGEKVVWTGEPSPRAVAWNGLWRVLKLAAIAIGMVAVGFAILVLSRHAEALLVLGWLSLVPGIGAIGALIQVAWDAAAATGRRFVITDARIIVTNDWIGNRAQFLLPSPDLTIERRRQAGGRGTIVIHSARPRTDGALRNPLDRLRTKPLLVMHGVADLEAATTAIDRLLAGSRPA